MGRHERSRQLLDASAEGVDLIFQSENAMYAREAHAFLLGEPLHLTQPGDVPCRITATEMTKTGVSSSAPRP